MTFDERGHNINTTSYFVFGCNAYGNPPVGTFPTLLKFSGEGGNLDKPEAVLKNLSPNINPALTSQGKEAIGGIRFNSIVLGPDKSAKYIIVMGIAQKEKPEKIFTKFNSQKKIELKWSFEGFEPFQISSMNFKWP